MSGVRDRGVSTQSGSRSGLNEQIIGGEMFYAGQINAKQLLPLLLNLDSVWVFQK